MTNGIKDMIIAAAEDQASHGNGNAYTRNGLSPAQLVRADAGGEVLCRIIPTLLDEDEDVSVILQHLCGWVIFGDRYNPENGG